VSLITINNQQSNTMSKTRVKFGTAKEAREAKAKRKDASIANNNAANTVEAGCQRCRGLRPFSLTPNDRLNVAHGRCLKCSQAREFPLEIPKGYIPVIFSILKDNPYTNREKLLHDFALTNEQLTTVLSDIQKRYPWFSHFVLTGTYGKTEQRQ
jgi:hypothetical protein